MASSVIRGRSLEEGVTRGDPLHQGEGRVGAYARLLSLHPPTQARMISNAAYLRMYAMHKRGSVATRRSKSMDADGVASEREGGGQPDFVPRTELGRRLWRIRQRIVASGQPLLDWDGIESELRDRRGEA